MAGQGKRHCWECRRRCLVCDFTEPACKRCSASGIACPGYSHVKPTRIKWLAPGKVVSRARPRRNGLSPVPTLPLVDFPILFDITTEALNSCIYTDLAPIHELADGHNPHVYPLSTAILHRGATAPDYLRFGMLCMILSHRINRLRDGPQSKALTEKFYRYWGLAVCSLNEHLGREDARAGDMIIAGVMTLLITDVQNGTSLNWRCHLDGAYRLIMLRGGFSAVAGLRSLYPLLMSFWSLAVFGNTTSPASNLSMTDAHLSALPFLLDQYYAAPSPFQLCPLPLVAELVRISHLRKKAFSFTHSQPPPTPPTFNDTDPSLSLYDHDLSMSASAILARIQAFSPDLWSASKSPSSINPSARQDWLLIGQAYRAAAALYCLLSLQGLVDLDWRAPFTALQHARELRVFLTAGLLSRRIKRFLIWPLVLLGVCAGAGEEGVREFVRHGLEELSCFVGSSVPLTAKRVLEAFWRSAETGWDRCFERPYVFTAQIAVDTSPLYETSL
ncbi:fungal-specific transcription factor domain-containing protein [Achaetomium macrosporum]|uniref:Fungal-specific transcription factor domain-containing protein n=1 Tax=Achaetomium macrosporum TaxID=79813 RepID=A0AAN7CAM7_9PEZI|nr:fungal-specific transcription factor domain-containing protein [Achaetomium macrosporum]